MPLNIFDGSNWNPFKKAQVHDGTKWNDAKAIMIYDGSKWNTLSSLLPSNLSLPTMSWLSNGMSVDYGVGQQVTVDPGTWTNNPTSYTYKWYSAPYTAGTKSWSIISGQTTSSYILPDNLVGYYIKVEVTAINSYGSSAPATYNMPDQAFIIPQGAKNVYSTADSNTSATIHWDASHGANGYYIQWWQAGVYNEQRLPSSATSYQINTTDYNPQYGIGVFFAPTNNSNPAATALGYTPLGQPFQPYNVQGTATNADIVNIRPYPASAGIVQYTSQNSDGSYGSLFLYANNLTSVNAYSLNQTDSYYPVGNKVDTTSDHFMIQLYMTPGQTAKYTVTFYGAAAGYTATSWTSPEITITIPLPRPAGGSVALSGSGNVGTSITATNSGWQWSPTQYYTAIQNDLGSIVASVFDSSVSYTITQSDVDGGRSFRAMATAYNGTGAGDTVYSGTIAASVPMVYTYDSSVNYNSVYTGSHSECDGQYVQNYNDYTDYYRSLIYLNGVSTGTYREDPSQTSKYKSGPPMLVNGQCGYVDCSVCTYGYGPSYVTSVSFGVCASGSGNYHDCITPNGCINIPVFQSCTTCNTCTGYSSNYTAFNGVCASGQGYYRTCYTPGVCSNIEQFVSCVPQALSGKGVCLSYDVTNSASAFYYDCYSVGQCNTHTTNNRTPC
jgi:hypothetical protein